MLYSRNALRLMAVLSTILLLGSCSLCDEPGSGSADADNVVELDASAIAEDSALLQEEAQLGGYGEVLAEDGESVLIPVVSTDGDDGYVYAEQFERASTGGVTNPDEAVEYMQEGALKSNKALARALTAALPDGYETTEEQASAFLDTTIRTYAYDTSSINLDEAFSNAVSDLSESTGVSENLLASVMDEAFREAQAEAGIVLPVYEIDGKTKIGNFVVNGLR